MTRTIYTYRLDRNNDIISVGDDWDAFALENGGPNACASQVQGRPVWDFIAGDPMRMWLDTVLQLVRVRNAPIERRYRCDSPELRRFMLMRLSPEDDGVVRIDNELLTTERRAVPIHIRPASSRSGRTVRIRCSLCGRLKAGNAWQEPDFARAAQPRIISVAYSVCDACGVQEAAAIGGH